MQHLSEEQIVLHHYHDDDSPAVVEEHLAACDECRAQYDTIRRVLAIVSDAPVPERSAAYGDDVWNRLRWKLGAPRRRVRGWQTAIGVAAMIAIAFLAGALWHARNRATAPQRSLPWLKP